MNSEINLVDLGKRISISRNGMGFTQREMAEKLDISLPYYARFEYGTGRINIQLLAKLSKLTGVSTDWLLFGDPEENEPLPSNDLHEVARHLKLALREVNILLQEKGANPSSSAGSE